MNISRFSVIKLAGALLLVLSACGVKETTAAIPAIRTQALAPVTVNVDLNTTLTLNGTFKGIGIQDDSNMLWTQNNQNAGAVVPRDFDNVVKPRLAKMKLTWVRKFIYPSWFAPTSSGYTWNSAEMQGLYASLQAHKDNGTEVMFTMACAPQWIMGYDTSGFDTGSIRCGNIPRTSMNEDDFVRVVTDLMRHVYGADGSGLSFDNVKFLGWPNELGEGVSIAKVATVYQKLDTSLSAAGVRPKITLFGPDKESNQCCGSSAGAEAIEAAKNNPILSNLLGLYDWHLYYNPNNLAQSRTFTDNARDATRSTGKQVYVTEFNDNALNGSNDWVGLPDMVIGLINRGQAGIALWNIQDQIYDTGVVLDGGKWGLWRSAAEGYTPKTSYYVYSNISAHTVRNSNVYQNSCDTENCGGLRYAALASSTNAFTFLAYNRETSALPVSTQLSNSSINQTLYRYLVDPSSLPNQATDGDLQGYDATVQMVNGRFEDTIPAGAFAVYSSVNPSEPRPSTPPALSGFYKLVNKSQGTVIAATGETYNNTAGVFNVAAVPAAWVSDGLLWAFQSDGNGYYKLVNKAQGTAIAATGETYNNTARVYNLAAVPASWNSDGLLWQVQMTGSGYYKLVNKSQGTAIAATGETYNNNPGVFNIAAVPGAWVSDGLLWQFVRP